MITNYRLPISIYFHTASETKLHFDPHSREVNAPGFGCYDGYRSGDLLSYDTPVWEVIGSGPGCQIYDTLIYEAMTPQCGRSVVQVLVVRVDIRMVICEAMTPQCGRSVIQVLVVRVDIGVMTYEAITPQCGRSVVQVLVVRVDIGEVTY